MHQFEGENTKKISASKTTPHWGGNITSPDLHLCWRLWRLHLTEKGTRTCPQTTFLATDLRVRRYPRVGECTFPLRVLGVQCVTLRDRCGALRNVTGALRSRCGTSQGVTDALRKHYGALRERYRAVTEHYGSVTGRYRTLRSRYGTLWSVTGPLRNVTEPLRKISILRGCLG